MKHLLVIKILFQYAIEMRQLMSRVTVIHTAYDFPPCWRSCCRHGAGGGARRESVCACVPVTDMDVKHTEDDKDEQTNRVADSVCDCVEHVEMGLLSMLG